MSNETLREQLAEAVMKKVCSAYQDSEEVDEIDLCIFREELWPIISQHTNAAVAAFAEQVIHMIRNYRKDGVRIPGTLQPADDLERLAIGVQQLIPTAAEALADHDAEIERKARLEEAKWWQKRSAIIYHLPSCSFDSTDGPAGDICDCGLRARRAEVQTHLAELEGK